MKYLIWVGMALVTMIMLLGGASKLMGVPEALESFSRLGLPTWFATFIGIAEISGAIGIWIKRTSLWAALGISIIMIGALYYHISFPPLAVGIPALFVLLMCGFIASRRGTGVV